MNDCYCTSCELDREYEVESFGFLDVESDNSVYSYDDEIVEGDTMSSFYVGQVFSTGNDVVNQLPAGAELRVYAKGQLQITFVPQVEIRVGDRVDTKYGPATVVRSSSRLSIEIGENEVLYVADGTAVVRRAFKDNVSLRG